MCRIEVDDRTHDFRTLPWKIFETTKMFSKSFLSVHIGTRPNILGKKNCSKSRDTVPDDLHDDPLATDGS